MGAANDGWEESDTLEFKDRFDSKNTGDWCEQIKDIVAMANSGGERTVMGANDDGTHSAYDTSIFLGIDIADFINKIHKYIEIQFLGFRTFEILREQNRFAVL